MTAQLGEFVESHREGNKAIAVLRTAVGDIPATSGPTSSWQRSPEHSQPPHREDAIRYYTAARPALRPETGLDLAEVLNEQGRSDDAEAIYQELVRRIPRVSCFSCVS